jgi:hypothetical protein
MGPGIIHHQKVMRPTLSEGRAFAIIYRRASRAFVI